MKKEIKRFPAFQLKIDEKLGIVEHIIAVMGNVDHGNDRIHNGAFAKTIVERGGKIKVLDNHRQDTVMAAIGKSISLREIDRNQLPAELLAEYPDATGALVAKTQFLMGTDEGRGAFIRIRDGAIDEYSIGYEPMKGATEFTQREGMAAVRELKEIKLYEYSPVLFGMNSATMTISSKKSNGKMDLPIADRNKVWDAAKADERIREWAGGPDTETIRWDDYGKAFFYSDPENIEEFSGYKLGFADIVDGRLTAIPRGLFAVAGGHGVEAADISQNDKDRIKRRVTRYYERMAEQFEDNSIISPFDKSGNEEEQDQKEMTPDGPVRRLGDVLQGSIHRVFTLMCDDLIIDGMLDVEERIMLSGLIGNALKILQEGIPTEIAQRKLPNYSDLMFMMSRNDFGEIKAIKLSGTINEEDNAPLREPRAAQQETSSLEKAGPVDTPPTSTNEGLLKLIQVHKSDVEKKLE